jgi:carbamoyltransferase
VQLASAVGLREAFRPFAPIVLAQRAKEIFEGEKDSPYVDCQAGAAGMEAEIPAIVHVDGTARVQNGSAGNE